MQNENKEGRNGKKIEKYTKENHALQQLRGDHMMKDKGKECGFMKKKEIIPLTVPRSHVRYPKIHYLNMAINC